MARSPFSWEGDAGGEQLLYQTEWMEQPEPLKHIPGTNLWGGDFPTPALPRTVCAWVEVSNESTVLPSARHSRYLLGPDLPPLPGTEGGPATLGEDVTLPTPGLASDERQVRIYLPHGYKQGQPYHVLYLTDGQMELGPEKRFPAMTDTLRHRGEMPPMILVAMDNAGKERPMEYLIGGSRNLAARTWVWETVIPFVDARYPAVHRWAVGGSNGASFAAQLVLGRPDLFDGGVFYSPWHRTGLEAILHMADSWPDGGSFAISHSTLGVGEQKHLPGARALAERLQAHGAVVHFLELEGYGHNFPAWQRTVPLLLRKLFSEVV